MTGCSDSFLDTELTGSTLSENQYQTLPEALDAHVRGLYGKMTMVSDHDLFGQKSIDIKSDMICGDIALTAINYGWFGSTASLNGTNSGGTDNNYIWNYYYQIIKNCNQLLKTALLANVDAPVTHNDSLIATYAGQAFAMRGYSYFILGTLYMPQYLEETALATADLPCVPIYTETSVGAQPQSSFRDVYAQAENDLVRAQSYLATFKRSSKTYIDLNVAKAMLAYVYLQRGSKASTPNDYDLAIELVDSIVANSECEILPLAQVTENGFNSIKSENWMWARDITTEMATGMASFFGQMDVHTYGYAFAGDIKAIDETLYGQIPATDERKKWFDTGRSLCPDKKFFDPKRGVKAADVDRQWLNDIVFLRIEEAYLIAAEAAWRNGDETTARKWLEPLLEQRDPTVAANVGTVDLRSQLEFNWRVELWGEGRGLTTWRRFGGTRTRGSNHFYFSGESITEIDPRVVFVIPSGEYTYNPYINQ
ncbi:MAG: RagB/SusD family nutrient uptake outer membrane protein [Prevotellaceae bacterium]|nr:RagB/SusD family nutrient uptake outer membrane protein [Prevotellaceae bacterium]